MPQAVTTQVPALKERPSPKENRTGILSLSADTQTALRPHARGAQILLARSKEQLRWGFHAGFPAELTAAGNICFLYKHQRLISHRAAQNSLLATRALLLHTLSPLCDYGQSQKGSTSMQHSSKPAGELPKLGCPHFPPRGAHLAVLVYRLL